MPEQAYDTFENGYEDPDIRLRRHVLAVVLPMPRDASAIANLCERADDPREVASDPLIVKATRRQRLLDQLWQLEVIIGNAALRKDVLANDFDHAFRSEEHTSELQSLMRISYAVFCLKQ